MLSDLVAGGCMAEGSDSVNNPLSQLGKSVLDSWRQHDAAGGSSSAQDAMMPPPPQATGHEAGFMDAFRSNSTGRAPAMAPSMPVHHAPPPPMPPMMQPVQREASEQEIHAALRNLDLSMGSAEEMAVSSPMHAHGGPPPPQWQQPGMMPPMMPSPHHMGMMPPPHPHMMMMMPPPPHPHQQMMMMPPPHMQQHHMMMQQHQQPHHPPPQQQQQQQQQQPLSAADVQRLDAAHAEAWRALASDHAQSSSQQMPSAAASSGFASQLPMASENALEAAYLETVAHGLHQQQLAADEEGRAVSSAFDEMEEVWKSLAKQERDAAAKGMGEGGAEDLDAIWQKLKGGDYEASPWDEMWKNVDDLHGQTTDANAPYTFHEANPYLDGEDLLARGTALFRNGELSEAVLVLEAAVQKEPEDTIAWQTLGQAHADADDDARAISCLRRSVAADPHNLDALLALGVSYTNELDQTRALEHLQRWLESHPDLKGLQAADDAERAAARKPFENPFELQRRVTEMFLRAVAARPDNADLHAVLGVLYNLSRSYTDAMASFEAALRLRPEDYSLWNKLGATQANAMSCAEAVPCYVKALECKPQYVRALSNLGISYGNMAQYEAAAQCYLKALSLNKQASHIWGYLSMTFTSMGRPDLVAKAQSGVSHEVFRADFDF